MRDYSWSPASASCQLATGDPDSPRTLSAQTWLAAYIRDTEADSAQLESAARHLLTALIDCRADALGAAREIRNGTQDRLGTHIHGETVEASYRNGSRYIVITRARAAGIFEYSQFSVCWSQTLSRWTIDTTCNIANQMNWADAAAMFRRLVASAF